MDALPKDVQTGLTAEIVHVGDSEISQSGGRPIDFVHEVTSERALSVVGVFALRHAMVRKRQSVVDAFRDGRYGFAARVSACPSPHRAVDARVKNVKASLFYENLVSRAHASDDFEVVVQAIQT